MTPALSALLAHLEADAASAKAAEAELRRALADQIARAERRRAFAFRRARLVRALASSVSTAASAEPDAAWAAQRQAVRTELGWSGTSESHDAILERLKPVGEAVRDCVCDPAASQDAVTEALAAFEGWFEAEHGKPFYVLFDQYMPEVPVVDF